jgi:hypothetical protein
VNPPKERSFPALEIENRNSRKDLPKDIELDPQLSAQLQAAIPEPRSDLHDNIMRRVRQTPQHRRPYTRIAAAMAAVLCLCVIGVALIEGGFSPSYAPDMDMSTDQNQAADGSDDFFAADSDGYFGANDMVDAEDAPLREPEFSPSLSPSEADGNPNYSASDKADKEEIESGLSDNPGSTQPPDAPTLSLPKKTTLRFTQNGNGIWTSPLDGSALYLYFGEANTLQLYDSVGHVAYGAVDAKGKVQLNGVHLYSGTLSKPDTKTYVLTLQRAD